MDKRLRLPCKVSSAIGRLSVAGVTLFMSLVALAIVLVEVLGIGGGFNGDMGLLVMASYLASPLLSLAFVGVLSRTSWGKWVGLVVTAPLLAAAPLGTAYYVWSAKVLRDPLFVQASETQSA